eukprot:93100-Chlamydomonas_euryale.AAC.2
MSTGWLDSTPSRWSRSSLAWRVWNASGCGVSVRRCGACGRSVEGGDVAVLDRPESKNLQGAISPAPKPQVGTAAYLPAPKVGVGVSVRPHERRVLDLDVRAVCALRIGAQNRHRHLLPLKVGVRNHRFPRGVARLPDIVAVLRDEAQVGLRTEGTRAGTSLSQRPGQRWAADAAETTPALPFFNLHKTSLCHNRRSPPFHPPSLLPCPLPFHPRPVLPSLPAPMFALPPSTLPPCSHVRRPHHVLEPPGDFGLRAPRQHDDVVGGVRRQR